MIFKILIALDQLANTLLGGWPDETLSARLWRNRASLPWRIGMHLVNGLFFWQKNHCEEAYESELLRRHLPPEFRP